jgi:recombination associated protein RdgC
MQPAFPDQECAMAFESGSISCRMLYAPRGMPQDAVKRFAQHAAPPIETLGSGEIHGWVGGRHLLDREIDDNNAHYGGYLRLHLMKAERKIPEPLLRAECKMQELARMRAEGSDALGRAARREIRKAVTGRLLPKMPPQLQGITFLYDATAHVAYVTALSDRQLDAFQIAFREAQGSSLAPVTPETAALKRRRANPRDWAPASFSAEAEDDTVDHDPGMDFLTWLWFFSEAKGGLAELPDLGRFAVLIEGPLTFHMQEGGVQEAVLRRGQPLLSAEASTSLIAGKKLRRARVTLARDNEAYAFTLDAPTFAVRGLKLPEPSAGPGKEDMKLDAVSRFQARMHMLGTFREAFLAFFDRFVDARSDATAWAGTVQEMRAWVRSRKSRP